MVSLICGPVALTWWTGLTVGATWVMYTVPFGLRKSAAVSVKIIAVCYTA